MSSFRSGLKPSLISLFVIVLITTISSSNLNWGDKTWVGIIESDAKGYYAYLPATFIYQDLNFGFFDKIEKEKYYNENLYYDYRASSNGSTINKYYCGTAIAQLPFFLIAHVSSYIFGYDTDGYSKPYPILINIAGLFYLLLGLLFLNFTLQSYQHGEKTRAITLFAGVFGTHLFYYAVVEPGLSHIYSFAFISMFFFCSRKYFYSPKKKYVFYLSVLLAMIILIRPINILIVFILPFAAGTFSTFKKGLSYLLEQKLYVLLCLLLCIAIVSIQFIVYKISTGSFFVYSYGDEGFNFLDPHFIDILFSYRKGLFLYTPLLFLSLLGCYFLFQSSTYKFVAWLGFFILITYIFSSWWMWYYGGSFSSRVYVEYIPLFMILLALSIDRIRPRSLKRFYISLLVLLIFVCQFQTFQYRHLDIHWSDMTKEKYWSVFLSVDKYLK